MIAIITAHTGVASTGTPGKENITGQSMPAATAARIADSDPGIASASSSSTTSCGSAAPDTKGSIAAAAPAAAAADDDDDDDDDRKDNASDDWSWRSRGMPYDVVTIVLQYVEAPPVNSGSPALAPASSHDRP